MSLPPRWVRRVVLAPAVVGLALLLLTTVPLWLLAATALTFLLPASLVPGRLRLPRVLWLAAFYIVLDAVALVALGVLWLASGCGWKLRSARFQRAHYRLGAWFLQLLFRQARWVLRLRFDLQDFDLPAGPVIIASRHAGPGDSLVLVHMLLNHLERSPRIVLKHTLQWDPAIDVLLNRLPNGFIVPAPFTAEAAPGPGFERDPASGTGLAPGAEPAPAPVPASGRGEASEASLALPAGATAQITDLAAGLGDGDALLIFPEGGNFSARRRRVQIDRLRQSGHEEYAARAEVLQHLMAPRPGGILAAIDAAPDASVVFVGHTGLDRMVTVGDLWRELPMDKRLALRGWQVPPERIPSSRPERIAWLFTWWERIEEWIAADQPAD